MNILKKFEEKDICPSKDASTVPVQLNPHHHRCNSRIRTRIYTARCPCNLPRVWSLFQYFWRILRFVPWDFHSSDYWWMLDLACWIIDLQEFRNNNLFITSCTAKVFFSISYHIILDLRDEILTPDHPNVNANVWRRASRNKKFKIIYFSHIYTGHATPHSQP